MLLQSRINFKRSSNMLFKSVHYKMINIKNFLSPFFKMVFSRDKEIILAAKTKDCKPLNLNYFNSGIPNISESLSAMKINTACLLVRVIGKIK